MAKSAQDVFDDVAAQMVAADARVVSPESERQAGQRFGASGLKVHGKLFALVSSTGQIVFKLPKGRVSELAAKGIGVQFDPGHGRLMKEWVAIEAGADVDWRGLAGEALAFVGR
jgi:hypothetical protein